MKHYLALLILTIGIFSCGGCFKTDMLIKVDSAGSGTIEENVLLPAETMGIFKNMEQQLKAIKHSGSTPGTPESGFNLFDEVKLKARASQLGEGVSYLSGKPISSGDGEGFQALYGFKDISKLRYCGKSEGDLPIKSTLIRPRLKSPISEEIFEFSFEKGDPSLLIIKIPRNNSIKIPEPKEETLPDDKDEKEKKGKDDMGSSFTMGGGAHSIAQGDENKESTKDSKKNEKDHDSTKKNAEAETPASSDKKAESKKEEMLDALRNLFSGMKFSFVVECGSEIVDTSATFREGNKVILMEFDMDTLLANETFLKSFNGKQDIKDMNEISKNLPGFKYETQSEVRVRFR